MIKIGQKVDVRKIYEDHKDEPGIANHVEELAGVQVGEVYKYVNKFREVVVKIKPDHWCGYKLTGFELSDTNCDVNKMHTMSNYDYIIRLS